MGRHAHNGQRICFEINRGGYPSACVCVCVCVCVVELPPGRVEEALKSRTHLFMGEAQLVLQDSLSISQCLNLIGEGVESICQRVREVKILHALWPRRMRRKRKREVLKREEKKKSQVFEGEEKGKRFARLEKKGTEEEAGELSARAEWRRFVVIGLVVAVGT